MDEDSGTWSDLLSHNWCNMLCGNFSKCGHLSCNADTTMDLDTEDKGDPAADNCNIELVDILQHCDHDPCIPHTKLDLGIGIHCDLPPGNCYI